MVRWWRYTKTYFPLYIGLPLAVLFALTNGYFALSCFHEKTIELVRLIVISLLTSSFFYRYYLFTALRESEEPSYLRVVSPILNGSLSFSQARNGAYVLIGFELILTSWIGWNSLVTHLVSIGYSLLIYHHFFALDWLCKFPLLYMMLRSFVLVFVGFSIGVTASEVSLFSFPPYFYLFVPINWMFLNLHELTKKPSVYLNLYLKKWFYLMISGQVILVNAFAFFLFPSGWWVLWGVVGLLFLTGKRWLFSRYLIWSTFIFLSFLRLLT